MKLEYYDFARGEVPDDRVKALLEPPHIHGKSLKDFEASLRVLLEEKLVPKLEGVKRVLILVDDITRQTPVSWILPTTLALLNRCGVRDESITMLVATGTHRPMTLNEQVRKYGELALKRLKVIFHNYKSDVVKVGVTSKGTPVVVNKLVLEHDLIMGIGMVVPHRVAGFSGGGKIVQPGISGEETTGETHWLSAQFEGKDILGKIFNPVRDEIEMVAKMAGLSFIINVVSDRNGKPIGVFAGDPLPTFKEAAEFAKEVYGVRAPRAKIVITDSYPADIELWQAAKGVYSADLILEDGGVVILVTPCPEGVGVEFGDLIVEHGYRGYEEVKDLVSSGRLKNLIVAAHLVHVGRVIRDKGRGVLLSPGISDEVSRKLGFIPARSLNEAIEIAQGLVGRGEMVICRCGGEILPMI